MLFRSRRAEVVQAPGEAGLAGGGALDTDSQLGFREREEDDVVGVGGGGGADFDVIAGLGEDEELVAREDASGGFYVARGGAAFPIVDIVEDNIEVLAGQGGPHRVAIVTVRLDVANPAAQSVLRSAMEQRYRMPLVQQLSNQGTADEARAADNQALH